MSVRLVLERKGERVVAAPRKTELSEILHLLSGEAIGAVMLTGEDGALVGIVSERDVIRAMSCFGPAAYAMPADDVMSPHLVTCAPDTSLGEVLTLMSRHGIRHLPVVCDGAIAGLVSVRDILDLQAELLRAENEQSRQSESELRRATEALKITNGGLEGRVLERTESLRQEIAERQRAEKALLKSNRALERRIEELEQVKRKLEIQGEELEQLSNNLRLARDVAEEANRTKCEFFSSMSHELRTPLNAIIGFSEIMDSQAFGPVGSPRYREYVGDIHGSAQRLLSLINDLLDMSNVEAERKELVEENVNVLDLARAASKMVRNRAAEKQIRLDFLIESGAPLLRVDRCKVQQILVNLLSNAINFTKKGGRVTIKAWCREQSGYVIQIADTGIGIAPHNIPRALTQLGQIDSRVSREENEGTGLGLPLAKGFVELHGGSLDLQSAPGVGTIVTLRFPATRIEMPAGSGRVVDIAGKIAL